MNYSDVDRGRQGCHPHQIMALTRKTQNVSWENLTMKMSTNIRTSFILTKIRGGCHGQPIFEHARVLAGYDALVGIRLSCINRYILLDILSRTEQSELQVFERKYTSSLYHQQTLFFFTWLISQRIPCGVHTPALPDISTDVAIRLLVGSLSSLIPSG